MPHLVTLGRAELRGAEGLGPGKPFAVLVYLALAEGPVTRRDLGRLLWPDTADARARHSVRQALSRIRKVLGPEVLSGEDPVALAPGRVTTDVAVVRRALAGDPLEAAPELLRLRGGPFLADLQLPDAPPFERWAENVRDELDRSIVRALVEASALAVSAGRPAEAVRYADAGAELAPYDPAAGRARVEARLSAGDVESARAALREARVRLEGLGMEEDLASLERRLEENAFATGADAVGLAGELDVVGRDRELAALARRWELARSGAGEVVVVAGAVGLGKTRLAEQLSGEVVRSGGRVVQLRTRLEAGTRALSLVRSLVRRLRALPGSAGTSPGTDHALRALDGAAPSPELADALPRIVDALLDLVGAVAFEAPLLMVVDDLDHADAPSVEVLLQLARRIRTDPVMLLITTTATRPHHGGVPLRELIREVRGVLLTLDPLSAAEIALLLERLELAGGDDAVSIAGALEQVTGGIPLLLAEVLERAERAGAAGPGAPHPFALPVPAPPSAGRLAGERLERVSAAGLAVAAALLDRGGRATQGQLYAGVGLLSPSRVAGAVEELLERGVIAWAGDELRFAHDALADAVGAVSAQKRDVAAVPDRLRRRLRVVAAGVVLLALGGFVATRLPPSGPPAYGGGEILVRSGDGWLRLVPGAPEPSAWSLEPLPDTLPPVHYAPIRLVDGSVRWYDMVLHPDRGPDLAEVRGGVAHTVVASAGDINLLGLSADFSRLFYLAEDTTSATYRQQIWSARPDNTDRRLLYTGRYVLQPGGISRDGQLVAFVASGRPDTLRVITAAGDSIARLLLPRITHAAWCGERLMLAVREEGTLRLALWTPGDTSILKFPEVVFEPLLCSPDGSAALHNTVLGNRATLVLRSLATGTLRELPPLPAGARPHAWLPASVPPVPVHLEGPDTLVLGWGERRRVDAAVLYSDGRRDPAEGAVWHSLAPEVASVGDGARVTANYPGAARLVGTLPNGIRDTVPVVVHAVAPRTIVVHERFEHLDTTRWLVVGEPLPTLDTVDGEPALRLGGDEKYADGLVLRRSIGAGTGLTVEMEMRAPITQNDYQNFVVCLHAREDPEVVDRGTGQWSTPAPAVCVMHPTTSGPLRNFREITYGAYGNPTIVKEMPTPFGARWFHLAIQLRPDGVASFYLDHRLAAELPVPLDLQSFPAWTLQINARTVGTEAHVRTLSIWTEPRFPH